MQKRRSKRLAGFKYQSITMSDRYIPGMGAKAVSGAAECASACMSTGALTMLAGR
jgi:hypothetical protein